MDANPRSTAEEALALFDRLKALNGELIPLQATYRSWAREYEKTGVPHNYDEFFELQNRIADLKREIRMLDSILAALGGGR